MKEKRKIVKRSTLQNVTVFFAEFKQFEIRGVLSEAALYYVTVLLNNLNRKKKRVRFEFSG